MPQRTCPDSGDGKMMGKTMMTAVMLVLLRVKRLLTIALKKTTRIMVSALVTMMMNMIVEMKTQRNTRMTKIILLVMKNDDDCHKDNDDAS